jgi:squalene-associated FAD-dependent desaturase
MPPHARRPKVVVIGGGLAGLAATAALVERDCDVELLEARRQFGGRAGSFIEKESGEAVDHCQHVAMGCCTAFLNFCRRTGVAELLERHPVLHFIGPRGERSRVEPSRWLPPPLHLAAALLGLNYLSWSDKWGIARAMLRLQRLTADASLNAQTMRDWLRGARQSAAAMERFWHVVLISALAESLDRISVAAARKVFVDGFLASAEACAIYIPRVTLSELYDVRVAGFLKSRGARLRTQTPVTAIEFAGGRTTAVKVSSGERRECDYCICAAPWRRINDLLPPGIAGELNARRFECLESSPITSVHLWFDRAITDLPHAVLVGRLSQWIFARPLQQGSGEHYYQVVISGSRELAARDRESIAQEVLADLQAVLPAARTARLLRWKVITDAHAVFSMLPGVEQLRPSQETSIPNLFLAGDWTSTGWPATMEGAVRSGYLAAESVLRKRAGY